MIRQYVGARYVPKFASPVEWASGTSYEALTIVTFNNASYTSKVPVPPTVGNPANNPQYWALTGNYNAQVEQYRQETETVSNNLTTEITNRKNVDTDLQGHITTVSNNLTAEITNRKNADTTLQGNINSEAATRSSADSNLQSQINQIVAPSGEAPSAAEVQNARIGADGVAYDTLGTAIRTQVGALKDDLSEIVIEPINLLSSNNPDVEVNLDHYFESTDGSLGLKTGRFVACLIKVRPNTKYTFTRVGYKCFGVASDKITITEQLVDWQGNTGNTTIITGANTEYVALNYGTDYYLKYAMFARGDTLPPDYVPYHKPYFGNIELNNNQISQVVEKTVAKKKNIVTVKKDGSGNYTKIKDAVNSITDATENNTYDIHIYSGTYDIIDELGGQNYIDSITGEEESIDVGIKLPPYVNLIGIGNVVLTAYGSNYKPNNNFGKLFSPINLQGTNTLINLKIYVDNCRYAVHDETNGNYIFSNKTRKIIGCNIKHNSNSIVTWTAPNAYAVGFDSGDLFVFENTYMYSGSGNAISFHDRSADVVPSTITFKACRFDSQSTDTVKFGSVGGAYHYVNIIDTYINKGISCMQESGGNYCNFIIKGNCNKEIIVKYKNNVPMIQNFANFISWGQETLAVGKFIKNTSTEQAQLTNDVNIAVGVCIDADNKIMQQYGYISKSIFTEKSMTVGDTLCLDNGVVTINGINKFAIYDGKFSDYVLLKLPLLN